jgi:hypothetical protein
MMGFDDSLPIERYQNPKSKNAVLAMGNVFSATDCTYVSSCQLYQWKGFNEYALDKYEPAESSFARAIFLGNKKCSTYYSLGLTQLHLKKY